jgi:diguanylate cyclase (GGDEF)-like protein/PAS domain S-box-containing protein
MLTVRQARGCLVWLAVLSWCASAAPAFARDKVRLQLRWQHQYQFAGYYMAIDHGYYAEAGLDVTLIEGAAEREPVTQVTQGKAEYGIGTSDLVLARAQKKPVVVLAPVFQHSPLVLIALANNGIESVHDLIDKRVAMEHEAAELRAYLESEGVPESSLRIETHRQDVAAVLRGDVDAMSAYVTDEPYAIREAGREVRVFSPRASGIDFYGDTLFTSERELSAHPERVRAFVRASMRGWQDAINHPEAAIDAVLRRTTRHTREHLRFEARRTAPLIAADIVELGYINPGRFQHIVDVYAQLKLLPEPVDLKALLYRPNQTNVLPSWVPYALSLSALALLVIGLGWARSVRLGRELARANARWRAFVESTPQPIVIMDAHGAIQYWNPSARSLFGDNGGGQQLSALLTRSENWARLSRAREGKIVDDVEVRLEGQAGHPSRWLALSCAAIHMDEQSALLISIADVTARKTTETRLRREADTDPLTGMVNRRRGLALLADTVQTAADEHRPVSVAMLDIDRFKRVNDEYGHTTGDRLLVAFSDVCRAELRRNDVIIRFGGEEFLVVFPDTDLDAAHAIGERLREAVRRELSVLDGRTLGVTVSIGIASARSDDDSSTLVARADSALYRAKGAGRNAVCLDTLPH